MQPDKSHWIEGTCRNAFEFVLTKNKEFIIVVRISSLLFVLFLFVAYASASITVQGRVTGTDGRPMSVARVFLTYPSDDHPIRSVDVRRNGEYKIVIDSEGLWVLHFTATFHHEYQIAIYADTMKRVGLDVKLGTYSYIDNFDGAGVIGNFNGWSLPRSIDLNRDQDGTYSAVADNKSDTLIYRLINVRADGEVEGTDANGFVPNGIEGYNSFLIARKGKVKIVFDPRKLVRSDQRASFKLITADSIESRFAKSYAILEDTRQAYTSSLYWHVAEHKMGIFKFDFAPIIDSVKNLLNTEPEGLIRQVLQLDYFGLTAMSTFIHYVEVKTSRQTSTEIPPNSIIWSLDPGLLSEALNNGAFSEFERAEYIRKVVNTNPMSRTKSVLLRDEIVRDFHSLDYVKILPYLSILLDQYGDSPEALNEGKMYSADYIHLKGSVRVPAFSVGSLTDSTQHFTNDSFKDKYYLLDFWATWNRQSLDEIKNLRKAYERYKDKNFEMLSVSLDSSSDTVKKFQHEEQSIPWLNGFVNSGFDNKICKDFEVYSVPKAILVGPKGNIAAIGWDLRGDNLGKTLERFLEK